MCCGRGLTKPTICIKCGGFCVVTKDYTRCRKCGLILKTDKEKK